MLALVAPITMSTEQQELWLRAAMDALHDIRAEEVQAVSAEVRRTVTRPAQIVPEIARLVAARRAERSRIREITEPVLTGPRAPKHIMDRNRATFEPADWDELNEYLKRMGSSVRYGADGTRLGADPNL